MPPWLSRQHPPSGAIPRFPVWEVTVMVFVVVAGIVGLLTPDSQSIVTILGNWSNAYYIALILCGFGSLVGMSIPVPNGLIIHLASMTLLTVSAGSVVAGIAALRGDVFFTGSITLYVFAFGSLLRAAQIQYQLYRINKGLYMLSNNKEGKVK